MIGGRVAAHEGRIANSMEANAITAEKNFFLAIVQHLLSLYMAEIKKTPEQGLLHRNHTFTLMTAARLVIVAGFGSDLDESLLKLSCRGLMDSYVV